MLLCLIFMFVYVDRQMTLEENMLLHICFQAEIICFVSFQRKEGMQSLGGNRDTKSPFQTTKGGHSTEAVQNCILLIL